MSFEAYVDNLIDKDFEFFVNDRDSGARTRSSISGLCKSVQAMCTDKCTTLQRTWASLALLLFDNPTQTQDEDPLAPLQAILNKQRDGLNDLLSGGSDSTDQTSAKDLYKTFALQTIWASVTFALYDSVEMNNPSLFAIFSVGRGELSKALRDPAFRKRMGLKMDDAKRRLDKIRLREEKLDLLSRIVDWEKTYPNGAITIKSEIRNIICKKVSVEETYRKQIIDLLQEHKDDPINDKNNLMRLLFETFLGTHQKQFMGNDGTLTESFLQCWNLIVSQFTDPGGELDLSTAWDNQIPLITMISAGEVIKGNIKLVNEYRRNKSTDEKYFMESRAVRDHWMKVRIAFGFCDERALAAMFKWERKLFGWNEDELEVERDKQQAQKKSQPAPAKNAMSGLLSLFSDSKLVSDSRNAQTSKQTNKKV